MDRPDAEWDGRPLGRGGLAIAIDLDDDRAGPRLRSAAACRAGNSCSLRPGQIGPFLLAHGAGRVACFGIGPTFWAIEDHLRAGGESEALEMLWHLAREGLLHDVQLLDQLLRGLLYDEIPGHRALEDLVAYYVPGDGTPSSAERDAPLRPAGLEQRTGGDPVNPRILRHAHETLSSSGKSRPS